MQSPRRRLLRLLIGVLAVALLVDVAAARSEAGEPVVATVAAPPVRSAGPVVVPDAASPRNSAAPADLPVAVEPLVAVEPPTAATEPPPPAPPPGPAPEVPAATEVGYAAAQPPELPPPGCDAIQSPLVAQVHDRVNALRAVHGVAPLQWDGQLSCLAREWADVNAAERRRFHRDLDAVLRSDGWLRWEGIAENLVSGGTVMDAEVIVAVWLTSPTHTATMLSTDYQWTGIGIATDGELMFVTQNFGRLR